MSHPLDIASSELLSRLEKQRNLPPATSSTNELGGVAKAGALLEKLLLLVLEDIAQNMGTTADALIARMVDDKLRAKKATGGQLSRTLAQLGSEPAAAQPNVRLLVREARLPANRLRSIIEARNLVIHGTEEPASSRQALAGLYSLLQEYRRDAGWDPPAAGRSRL